MLNLAAGFQSLPVEYQNVIRLAQERNQIAITPLQALAGGWSGAMVFLVSVASQNPDRIEHYVLKLDRKNEKSQSDEIRRHEAAVQPIPARLCRPASWRRWCSTASRRMARLPSFTRLPVNPCIATKRSRLTRSKIRSKLPFPTPTNTCSMTGMRRALLSRRCIPQRLLEHWLSFRLKPGGNIENFLETVCRIPPEMAGYLVQGSIFPNPLAYARHPEWWGTRPPYRSQRSGFSTAI